MQNEKLKKLQAELDVQKWNDAQAKGVDTCGTYAYCAKCDKNAEYPCAAAKTASEAKTKAPAKKAAKPAAAKTVAVKPVEAKPVEVKPVEAKPAEVKPAADKVACAKKTRAKKA